MVNVFINAAHTSFSPGAMIYGRTEHSDVLAFARMLSMELERYEGIKCEYYTGNCRKGYSDEDIVIILHRGSNSGNDNTYGCDITVKSTADAATQYDAFRLLQSLGGEKGFRLKKVHVNTGKSPFRQMEETGSEKTFLVKLGYIDSYKDNSIFDKNLLKLAQSLAEKINEVFGGKYYGTDSAV